MRKWDKRRRKLDEPMMVGLENGDFGTVTMSPQCGCVQVDSVWIPLDDLKEVSFLALLDAKCHHVDEQET